MNPPPLKQPGYAPDGVQYTAHRMHISRDIIFLEPRNVEWNDWMYLWHSGGYQFPARSTDYKLHNSVVIGKNCGTHVGQRTLAWPRIIKWWKRNTIHYVVTRNIKICHLIVVNDACGSGSIFSTEPVIKHTNSLWLLGLLECNVTCKTFVSYSTFSVSVLHEHLWVSMLCQNLSLSKKLYDSLIVRPNFEKKLSFKPRRKNPALKEAGFWARWARTLLKKNSYDRFKRQGCNRLEAIAKL